MKRGANKPLSARSNLSYNAAKIIIETAVGHEKEWYVIGVHTFVIQLRFLG
jgi:hypothetical protein